MTLCNNSKINASERRENTFRAVLVHHKSSIIVSSVGVGIEEWKRKA
jgi:hypothetical protein